jgi:dTDP-4-amino-4,6-dideoxygalactose transaminase
MADLAARHARLAERVEAELLRVLRSGRWVGGEEVAACETELAARLGRRHGVGLNSGTDALLLGLQAIGVGPGDEVLVPALSFFATAGAVARAGALPVVVDVLEERPLMDPARAAERASSRTRAVVPVHLFGMPCPDPGLPIACIEDSAQALGREPAPRLGLGTALSLYPTKTVGGAGDGGLFACDDDTLAERVRRLASHGARPDEAHLHDRIAGCVGTNSRLDALQAVLVRAQLQDLEVRVARRREIASLYDARLPSCCRAVPRDPEDPLHQYVLRCERRDALREHLLEQGIESSVYYPRPLSLQPALQPQGACPIAESWCREILSLPCHESLSPHDADRVAEALTSFRP